MSRGKHVRPSGGAHAARPANRVIRVVGYPLTFAALCALACGPGYAMAEAAADEAARGEGGGPAAVSDQASNAPVASEKDETVYVFAHADGSVRNVEVSDRLVNAGKSSELADSSSLTGIENVEGDESFRGSGDAIVWDAQGNDIYYRGDSDEQPPLSLKATYRLDGREVAPADLVGKSGDIEVSYAFENRTAGPDGTAVPFVALTGMLLDNGSFSDISVDHGRVIDDGDRTVVIGYALPGLAGSLGEGVSDEDLPDGFTVRAKAQDFAFKSTLTMATGDFLDSVDFDRLDASELDDASAQLKDAMSQLLDGSGELSDGLGELADGAGSLADGTAEMQGKVSALPDGVQKLYDGSGSLADGLGTASAGASSLATGAASLNAGLVQILGDGSAANPGITALQAGAHQLHDQLAASQASLVPQLTALVSGLESAQGALISAQSTQSVAYLNAAADRYIDAALSATDDPQVQAALAGAKQCIAGSSTVAATVAGQLGQAEGQLSAADIGSKLEAAASGAGQVAAGLDQAAAGMRDAVGGSSQLASGASQLSDSLPAAADGAAALRDGLGSLNGSAGTLVAGVKQVVDGASQLASGAEAAHDGSVKLGEGLAQFNDEGITKITDLLDGDIASTLENLEATRDAGERYDNFSGITQGTKGTVKFVIEVDAVE